MYAGTQFLWNMFFDFASYSSAVVWLLFFGYGKIKEAIIKTRARRANRENINFQYTDQLNILQRAYPEVPGWW
jgi:hypothetical protein